MKSGIAFGGGVLVGVVISIVAAIIVWQNFLLPASPSSYLPAAQSPADLQSQVDDLARRVDKLETDQEFSLRDIGWRMDQKLYLLGGIALIISAIATFFGWRTYKDLDGVIREKINTTLEKELYQLDPTNLPIRLVVNEDMPTETDRIWKRLGLTGLQNIEKVSHLDKKCRRGVTILLIKEKEQEKKFADWLNAHRILEDGKETKERYLDARKAAFVVYTPPSKWLDDDTLGAYDNLATANMPPTVASMGLVVGRGLKNSEE